MPAVTEPNLEFLRAYSKDDASFQKLCNLFSALHDLAFLQAQLDALPFQAVILDADSMIIMINTFWRNSADTGGFTDKNYGIGSNYLAICDVSAGDDAKEAGLVAQGLRDLMAGKITAFHLDYPCARPERMMWYSLVIRPFTVNGHLYMIMLHQDITNNVENELRRQQTQRLYELLASNLPGSSIFLFDHTLRYTLAEGPNIAASGRAKADFIGKTLYDIFPKEIADRDTPILQAALEGVTTVSEIHYGDRYYEVQTLPVRDETGEIAGGMVLTLDITTIKQGEEAERQKERLQGELHREQELNELKNRMMYRISHEFRTPLAVIQSSTDLLYRYYDRMEPELRERHFIRVKEEINELASGLDDLSFIMRTNKARVNPVEIHIAVLCQEILNDLRQTIATSRVFTTHFEASLPPVMADRNLLRSILTNLISNAVKYSDEEQPIHIETHISTAEIGISVRDHGSGMNEEERRRLFEPFYRGSNIGKKAGMGLGMSIVKEATELQGGRLEVESTPGEGTIITLFLPRVAL